MRHGQVVEAVLACREYTPTFYWTIHTNDWAVIGVDRFNNYQLLSVAYKLLMNG